MLLKCFKFFYIKDNSVGNSVDFNKKKMDPLYSYYYELYIVRFNF